MIVGILLSASGSNANGLLTDGAWTCSKDNGVSWTPAHVIGPNGMKPWGTRPDISTAAKWIWTTGWKGKDKHVRCKIDLGKI